MSGEEVRDVLFGRLFGFMAIIASGMLSRSTTTMDDINKILDSLLEIGRLKAYLMEVCYYVVINMLPNVSSRMINRGSWNRDYNHLFFS